jgi:hypothetical protein
LCVTETKDTNNLPISMFTPTKEHFIIERSVKKGMGLTMPFNACSFDFNFMMGFELFEV